MPGLRLLVLGTLIIGSALEGQSLRLAEACRYSQQRGQQALIVWQRGRIRHEGYSKVLDGRKPHPIMSGGKNL